MKLSISPRFPVFGAVIVTVLLSGCGQTGPLYLPKVPPAPASQQANPAPDAASAVKSDAK